MNRTTPIAALTLGLWNAVGLAAPPDVPAGILGYSARAAAAQREVESKYRAIPSAEEARQWHRRFTAVPHPPTSKANDAQAEDIAEQWRQQGIEDVVIRRYDVLSSNPREVKVEMVTPVRYVPTLREDPYPEDPDTRHPDISGGWISFSASGDVTAPVVYANSGNPADYDVLRQNGIDPRGKIVVVRYSNPYSYRGFKALTAQREGAAAMIIYSDPAEDGSKRGKVFPDGPWGPASHIQRGGIAYDYIVPGDPLTPGWASTPGAHRIPVEEAVSVPKIIAVALSHRDMQPILEKLGGPAAPKEWQGGLPIEYRLGGAAATIHIKSDMQTDVRPNYVVEGRLTGSEIPDEWVVLGNHHDAWVFGGVDPSSGTAAMMEVTRAKRATGPLADKLVGFARGNIEQLQRWLSGQLGNRAWFNGASFGWGDIACAPYINRSAAISFGPPKGSPLAAWLDRVNQRPAIGKVIEQMQATLAGLPDFAALIGQGKIKRQYRDHRLEWMIRGGGLAVVQEGIEKGSIRFSRLPD